MKIEEHIIDNLNQAANEHSPFTSIGTDGVLYKFGDGRGALVDVKKLRAAIASGEAQNVEIIEHADLVKYMETCPGLTEGRRTFALRCIKKDGEFLIKGEVPAKYIEKWGY